MLVRSTYGWLTCRYVPTCVLIGHKPIGKSPVERAKRGESSLDVHVPQGRSCVLLVPVRRPWRLFLALAYAGVLGVLARPTAFASGVSLLCSLVTAFAVAHLLVPLVFSLTPIDARFPVQVFRD